MEYEGKFYSELYCQELGVSIATNSVSRLFNSLNTAISLISLVLLMDVAIRHRKRFICHVSLTLLIYNLFISSIAHVLVYFVAQSEENASTAFLVCGILVTHYCVFLIYRSLYLLTNVVADTPRELEVYRSASHVLSLSPLLLGILTIWYFREVRRTRKMRITTLVSMQSNGADGWNNYASVLGSQWSRQ
ncbi:hypothetical protein Y032_0200g1708 [Ancylostoma ceylanicum]|uniref:Uncharacterized protein n=1 Tax=Ancylostoma ceylanicum TaxID=53326 RepID=A0A016SNM1_9BILA|nr:hypothetical protein Y032_0200g1708 [Ancylostoma ceylanicum]